MTHAAEVAALAELVTSTGDCLFMSGSRLEGLGNAHSDWDYYLVLDGTPETRVGGVEAFTAPTYLDCEVLPATHVASLAVRVSEVTSDASKLSRLSHGDLDLYYRLLIGRPVRNEDRFLAIQAAFDRETFEGVYERWAIQRATPLAKLAAAALGRDDAFAAVSAREAFVWVTEAALCRSGEAYPKPKWWYEKSIRAYGEGSRRARDLWNLRNIGQRSLRGYVEAVLRFAAQELGLEVVAPPATGRDPDKRHVLSRVAGQICLPVGTDMLVLPGAAEATVSRALAPEPVTPVLSNALDQSWRHLLEISGVLANDG
jgi:hypothetical protein